MTQTITIDDVMARLDALPAKRRDAVVAQAMEATKHMARVPSPGPETEAYLASMPQAPVDLKATARALRAAGIDPVALVKSVAEQTGRTLRPDAEAILAAVEAPPTTTDNGEPT